MQSDQMIVSKAYKTALDLVSQIIDLRYLNLELEGGVLKKSEKSYINPDIIRDFTLTDPGRVFLSMDVSKLGVREYHGNSQLEADLYNCVNNALNIIKKEQNRLLSSIERELGLSSEFIRGDLFLDFNLGFNEIDSIKKLALLKNKKALVLTAASDDNCYLLSYFQNGDYYRTFKYKSDRIGKLIFGNNTTESEIIKYLYHAFFNSRNDRYDGVVLIAALGCNFPTPTKETNLLKRDALRSQLPELDPSMLTDPHLGLWDLYCPGEVELDERCYSTIQLDKSAIAADPWSSVQHTSADPSFDENAAVAIDFGTSSTVAAVRECDGTHRLLRIGGMKNTGAADYENPTVLEFCDYDNFFKPWCSEPYRPFVLWEHLKCSHVARNETREPDKAGSGLSSLKTWARKLPGYETLRLKDQKNLSFELAPAAVTEESAWDDVLTERGVDPVEVYAFHLGLALNNQAVFGGRIYTDYCMTFPVKFDLETKQRIMQGFHRGLLRSLPPALVYSKRWKEKPLFRLREFASEPTALAAALLPQLKLELKEQGIPFGVFDFGGGTADFAFGRYRLPTESEESEKGWESVLEIYDIAGDENLGGERLLDLLAFEVLKNNAAACLENSVVFECPPGYRPFDGSERLFDRSEHGRANLIVLREALRPVWEEGGEEFDAEGTGQISLNLYKRGEDSTGPLTLSVDKDSLRGVLESRISAGVDDFFAAFAQAFKRNNAGAEELHVILAGNSCRSSLVRKLFDRKIDVITPNKDAQIIVHYELLPGAAAPQEAATQQEAEAAAGADEEQPQAEPSVSYGVSTQPVPNIKTAVALGLLKVLPGEQCGIDDKSLREGSGSQSPFMFTVGTFKAGKLVPVLQRGDNYNEWKHIGKVFEGGVNLFGYSASPKAMELNLSRAECKNFRVDFGAENQGKQIFVKISGPRDIMLATGEDEQHIAEEQAILKILKV